MTTPRGNWANASDAKLNAYNAAVAYAVARAARHPVNAAACFTVYAKDDSMFVRPSLVAAPDGATMVCIVQRWDEHTVQLRFAGAHSEWRAV